MSNLVDIIQSAQGGQIIENLSIASASRPGRRDRRSDRCCRRWSRRCARRPKRPIAAPVLDAANESAHRAALTSRRRGCPLDSVAQRGDAIVAHLFGSPRPPARSAQVAARESGLRADVLRACCRFSSPSLAGGLGSTLERRAPRSPLRRFSAELVPSGGGSARFLNNVRGEAGAAAAGTHARPSAARRGKGGAGRNSGTIGLAPAGGRRPAGRPLRRIDGRIFASAAA